MGAMTHAAGRMAFSAAIDVALKDVRKNREEGIVDEIFHYFNQYDFLSYSG